MDIKCLCKLEDGSKDRAFPMQFFYGYDLGGYRFTDEEEALKYLTLIEGLTDEEANEYLELLISDRKK